MDKTARTDAREGFRPSHRVLVEPDMAAVTGVDRVRGPAPSRPKTSVHCLHACGRFSIRQQTEMSTMDANIITCVNNACLSFGKVQFLLKISHLFVNQPVCQVVDTVPLPCPCQQRVG